MRIILVCHGETAGDASAGTTVLSERGRRQTAAIIAEVAAASARGPSVVAVVNNGTAAARETSEQIAAALGLGPPLTEPGLSTDGSSEGHQRLWSAIETLRDANADDSAVVIVTGPLPIGSAVRSALGMPQEDVARFRIDAASLTALEFRNQPQRRVLLASLNETCHLE